MAWPIDIPDPIATPVGMHGSIMLGTTANALTAYEVSKGEFTPTANLVPKPSTSRGIVRHEPSLVTIRISFSVNADARNPPNFRVRDKIYFRYKVTGRWAYTGYFLLESNPDSFQADGDAPYDFAGAVQDITYTSAAIAS